MEIDKDLKECYKYVYTCNKCNREYGSDKQEKGNHICPICEGKILN